MNQIIKELKGMYPRFKFTMKYIGSTNNYVLTAFKVSDTLGTLTLQPETPMTEVWVLIKAWIQPLLVNY